MLRRQTHWEGCWLDSAATDCNTKFHGGHSSASVIVLFMVSLTRHTIDGTRGYSEELFDPMHWPRMCTCRPWFFACAAVMMSVGQILLTFDNLTVRSVTYSYRTGKQWPGLPFITSHIIYRLHFFASWIGTSVNVTVSPGNVCNVCHLRSLLWHVLGVVSRSRGTYVAEQISKPCICLCDALQ